MLTLPKGCYQSPEQLGEGVGLNAKQKYEAKRKIFLKTKNSDDIDSDQFEAKEVLMQK